MAFTQADLDAVDRAIASGELTVRTNDRSITYRSFAELRDARSLIASALAAQAASTAPIRHQLASFSDD